MIAFYIDISKNQTISWDNLLDELSSSSVYSPYCLHSDFYAILKHIVLSIVLEEEVILLDTDFTRDEIENLVGLSSLNNVGKAVNQDLFKGLDDSNELLKRIRNVGQKWSITLFTSGTTGLPKKVTHSFQSITRFVKQSAKNKENVWGLAYNPTHMAGIQVFFQALLNGNPIVKLFGLPKEQIFESIVNFKVTNISATPTFYRLLLPSTCTFHLVKQITSGGEKFDEKAADQLKHVFPNAKFTNIYASTEAGTLFASDGTYFTIKPEMVNYVKIQNNELLIHHSLLGKSASYISDWYQTRDIVELDSQDPLKFRFVSRQNEMINIGGYKVNPAEVEEVIRKIEGIQDVRVYAKSNSVLGNIICCEIVKTVDGLDELFIRSFLQTKLQEFKIPRLIKFTEKIITTRTGKIKRS